MCVCVCVCVRACVRACTRAYVCMYVCVCIYIYIYNQSVSFWFFLQTNDVPSALADFCIKFKLDIKCLRELQEKALMNILNGKFGSLQNCEWVLFPVPLLEGKNHCF